MTQQERMLELLSGIVSYVNFNCHGKICLLRLTYFYGENGSLRLGNIHDNHNDWITQY